MRALITRLRHDNAREKVLVDDWPEPPAPTGRQVRMRTRFTGITNGTERNDLLGGNYAIPDEELPGSRGYQNVGEVVEVGPDAVDLKVGDLVYSSATHHEYTVWAEDGLIVKLPPEIAPTQAALFGMSSVALHNTRIADIRLGETVLIVGAGFIGQVAAQFALSMGGHVTLVDLDAGRLAAAASAIPRLETRVVGRDDWESVIGDRSFDVVIDLAGAPKMEDRLVTATKVGGRLVFVAGRSRIDYPFSAGQVREITVKQTNHFTRSDLHEVARRVADGSIDIGYLIREVVPVEDADDVYVRLRDNPASMLGTVFDWG